MFMTILPSLSMGIGIVAIAASLLAIRVVRSERRDRENDFAKLAAGLAELRAEIEAMRPSTPLAAPDGRRNLRRDRGLDGPIPGPILIAVPDLAAPSPEAPTIPPEFVERFGGIWDLAAEGASADAIARATGQPIGRIELILALRPHDDDA